MRRIPTHRSSRGSAMVEMALVGLVVFSMVIAILDLGQVLFFHQAMTERASAGARWAVVHSFNSADTSNIKNMVVYNTTQPVQGAHGLFGLTPGMVTVTPVPSAANMRSIQVSITFTVHVFTPGIAGLLHKTVRSVRPVESLGATT